MPLVLVEALGVEWLVEWGLVVSVILFKFKSNLTFFILCFCYVHIYLESDIYFLTCQVGAVVLSEKHHHQAMYAIDAKHQVD